MATRLALPRRAIPLLLGLLLAIIVGAAAFVYFPSAKITVYTATHDRTINQDITLSTAATAPDFVHFVLPAKAVDKTDEDSKTITRGNGQTFEDFAKGQVTLKNDQDQPQALLPKTHLRHEASGVFFLTDTGITVPPHGEIDVSVTAADKGDKGDVAAGKFIVDRLPASMQTHVYGESKNDFSGGISINTPVSEDELNQAMSNLKQSVTDKLRGELTAAAGGARIRPELINFETQVEHASTDPGSKAVSFTVSTRIHASALIADDSDLLSLTLLALRSSPKPDEEFVSYKPDSFAVKITRSDFTQGQVQIVGTLTGKFASKTGPTAFQVDNLAGRSKAEVMEYFKQFPNIDHVDVAFSPFWVNTIPSRASATDITIQDSQ